MTDHIVRSYDAELEALRRSLAEMGGMSERMLGDSTVALVRRDTTLAQKVISADQRLDNLQRDVEERAVLTIARRQPLANDLRELISAIRIASDIERVGDLAKNIAKRAVAISGAFFELSSHPSRILTVTGTSTASTAAATRASARSGSRIRAEPAMAPPVTSLAGQPKLRSMTCAPARAASRAPSAIWTGSRPTSCTTISGRPSPTAARRTTSGRPRENSAQATISVAT